MKMDFTYCKLKDVLESIYSGGTPSTTVKEYWGGPYKWLSSGETGQRFITDTIDTITERGIRESSTKLAKRDSVVMACAGQGKTRGQTSFLLDDMYVNQSVIVLNPDKEKVLPLYLFYDLTGRYDELRGGSDASSTRGSITTTSLKTLSFRYPSMPEQKKIVSILSAYDNMIEVNNKRIKVLEQMAENLYKEWFVRFRFPGHETAEFENGIPKGWEIKRIGDISSIKAGGDRPEIYSDTPINGINVPIYSNGIENDGLYGFTNNAVITEESVTISARGTVGFVFLRRVPYVPIVRLIAIVPNTDTINSLYLFYYLQRDSIIANGTSQQQITVPMVSRKRIIVPTKVLLDRFAEMQQLLWIEKDNLHEQNKHLIKQRDLLLPRLMSGKLEV